MALYVPMHVYDQCAEFSGPDPTSLGLEASISDDLAKCQGRYGRFQDHFVYRVTNPVMASVDSL